MRTYNSGRSGRPSILTITLNPAIDLELRVPALLRGAAVRAEHVARSAGGKGLNVSRVLAALGHASTAACLVGGADGEVFLSLLRGARFEVAALRLGGPTRTNVTIASSPANISGGAAAREAARAIKVNQPGQRLSAAEWRMLERALAPLLGGRRWVILSGSLPPGAPRDAYARLARAAHRAGARVAIDGAGEPLLRALAARPDIVKLNRAELAESLNLSIATRAAALAGARELTSRGAAWGIVTHGKGEVLSARRNGDALAARPSLVRTHTIIGAGDAMLAGLIAGLEEDLAPPEALRLALACGAARTAIPLAHALTRRHVQAMLGPDPKKCK